MQAKGGSSMQRAEVLKLKPYFLNMADSAVFLGIAKKTLSNELSAGTFPIRPIYRGSKPLFPLHALLEYAQALEQQSSAPAGKRGRKRKCEGVVNAESRVVDLQKRKNPAGRRGGDLSHEEVIQ
jgi:hypothetical protein